MTWVWRRLDDAIVKYAHAKTNQLDRCRPVHQPHGPVNSLRQKINEKKTKIEKTNHHKNGVTKLHEHFRREPAMVLHFARVLSLPRLQ